MDTALATINQHKENYFNFDMTVDGLNADDADVRFVIKYKPDLSLVFPCEHESGSRWTVDMPPVPMLDATAYNFVIEVVIDGYYFEPFRGLLNVVGTPEVYVSKPEQTSTKKRTPLEVKAPGSGDRIKGREKGIEQIARETMAKAEKKVEKEDKKETVEETPTEVKKIELPEPKKSTVDVDAVIENVRSGKKQAQQAKKEREDEDARLEEQEKKERKERLAEEVRVREEKEVEEKRKKKEEKKRLDTLVEKAAEEVDDVKEELAIEEDNKLLDKPTPTIEELAKKHNVPLKDIRAQLAKGIKVEKEHASDAKIAEEIALDHLNELPDYYDRLETVEEVAAPKPVVDPEKDSKVKDVLKKLAVVKEPVIEEPVIEEVVDPIDHEKDSKVLEAISTTKTAPKKETVRAKKVTAKKVDIEPVVEKKDTQPEKDKAVKQIVTETKKPAKKRKVAKKKPTKKKVPAKKPIVEDVEKDKKAKKILEEVSDQDKAKKKVKKKTKKKLPVKKGDKVTRRRRRRK